MPKDFKIKIAEWIYGRGKERIDGTGIYYLNITASIFINLLSGLDSPLADKLYKYYNIVRNKL